MNQLRRFFHPRLSGKTIRPGKKRKQILFYNPPPWRAFLFGSGTALLLLSSALAIIWYSPLIGAFWRYKFGPPLKVPALAESTEKTDYQDFFIFIPKIKAKARVFANTPTNNRQEYLKILHQGVAHAKGTNFPGEGKTIYLFAHSTNSPFYATRLNAVFMLLNQLVPHDLIIIYFSGRQYRYRVVKKLIVSPKSIDYLHYPPLNGQETLILQTCYPPGTIWKRLLVFATKQ